VGIATGTTFSVVWNGGMIDMRRKNESHEQNTYDVSIEQERIPKDESN
jgi:hypothetical protein